jgi:hypothetical protein
LIEVAEKQKLDISLHQTDIRRHGVNKRYPYVSLGIAVLKNSIDDELDLIYLKDF